MAAGSTSFERRNTLSSWVIFSSTNSLSVSSHSAKAFVTGIRRPAASMAMRKPCSQGQARSRARWHGVTGVSPQGPVSGSKNPDSQCGVGHCVRCDRDPQISGTDIYPIIGKTCHQPCEPERMLGCEQRHWKHECARTCPSRIGGDEIPRVEPAQKERPPKELLHDGNYERYSEEPQGCKRQVNTATGTGRIEALDLTHDTPPVIQPAPDPENRNPHPHRQHPI